MGVGNPCKAESGHHTDKGQRVGWRKEEGSVRGPGGHLGRLSRSGLQEACLPAMLRVQEVGG